MSPSWSSSPHDEAPSSAMLSHDVLRRQLQDTLPTGIELVRSVFLILLTGVAILLGMIIGSYCVMLMVDKCVHGIGRGRNDGDVGSSTNGRITTTRPSAAAAANASVVRKAGLWGLHPDERRRILEHIFANCTSTYHAKDYDEAENDNNAMNNNNNNDNITAIGLTTTASPETAICCSSTEETSSNPTSRIPDEPQQQPLQQHEPSKCIVAAAVDTPSSNDDTINSSSGVIDATAKENVNDMELLHESQYASCCSICLSPYQENVDTVLTSKSCRHVFHYKCAMDWLLDRESNDHCPYCRKEMITADELRTTALQLLGPERVVEIGMWQGQRNEYYNGTMNNNNNSNNNNMTTVAVTTTTTLSSSITSVVASATAVRSGRTAMTTNNTSFAEAGGAIEMGLQASASLTPPWPLSANDVRIDHFSSSAEVLV